MSDLVTVKVLRMHSGDQGTHIEGETYETTKQHAAALADRRLVSVVGEVKADAKADPALEDKADPAPANKAAPAPASPKPGKAASRKADPVPENKAS